MYKAILFDFFDVIRTDQYKAWLTKYNLKREGPFEEVAHLSDIGQIDIQDFYARLGELSGQAPEAIQQEFFGLATVNEDVVALIKLLRVNGYKLGLISNSNGEHLRAILHKHDFEPLFDEIIISGEVGFAKPSKEIFEHMTKKLNLDMDEVIFIDDNPIFIEGAVRVGIESILFTDAKTLLKELRARSIKC